MDTGISGDQLRQWYTATYEQLLAYRDHIDALNVFPVHDTDTGTNMVCTVRAGLTALDNPIATSVSADFAAGALSGARGNSGVILSAWYAGFAQATASVAEGLSAAATNAKAAIADYVEGTIITVADAAAIAARQAAAAGYPLEHIVDQAQRGAAEALRLTPRQLPALADAGVVDAGGFGLLLVLRALATSLGGSPIEPPLPLTQPVNPPTAANAVSYEVQYHLKATVKQCAELRERLLILGESVVIAGDELGWHVHVHSADPGAVLQAGVDLGRLWSISVTVLPPLPGRALLLCAEGAALTGLLTDAGGKVIAPQLDSTELADQIVAVALPVVLFPNDAALAEVADTAAAIARQRGARVAVIHTRSPVQAFAALAVHDPALPFDEDVLAMAEAAAATRWAHVSVATFDAFTIAGRCRPRDALTIVEGEVVAISATVGEAAIQAVDRLLSAGGELLTVVLGAETEASLSTRLYEHANKKWPYVECLIHEGGQASSAVLLGVE